MLLLRSGRHVLPQLYCSPTCMHGPRGIELVCASVLTAQICKSMPNSRSVKWPSAPFLDVKKGCSPMACRHRYPPSSPASSLGRFSPVRNSLNTILSLAYASVYRQGCALYGVDRCDRGMHGGHIWLGMPMNSSETVYIGLARRGTITLRAWPEHYHGPFSCNMAIRKRFLVPHLLEKDTSYLHLFKVCQKRHTTQALLYVTLPEGSSLLLA